MITGHKIAKNNNVNGFDLQITRNTLFTNITAINNTLSGIINGDMKTTQIINVTASCNNYGMYLNITNNTNFSSITVTILLSFSFYST